MQKVMGITGCFILYPKCSVEINFQCRRDEIVWVWTFIKSAGVCIAL